MKKRFTAYVVVLVAVQVLALWGAEPVHIVAPKAPGTHLESVPFLLDTAFERGFSCRLVCKGNTVTADGRCVDGYEPTPNYVPGDFLASSAFPTLPAWDVYEGTHILNGVPLYEHRLCVAGTDRPSAQGRVRELYNNWGLLPGDPNRDRDTARLLRSVTVYPDGTLRMVYNSAMELDNVATAFTADFATREWPHFLVQQYFYAMDGRGPMDPSQFARIDLRFSASLAMAKDEPVNALGNRAASYRNDYALLTYILFRTKANPALTHAAGYTLYSSTGSACPEVLPRPDQTGSQFFYRDSAQSIGGVLSVGGPAITYAIEARHPLEVALSKAQPGAPYAGLKLTDIEIIGWNFGWEGIGNFKTDVLLGDVSMEGHRVVTDPTRASPDDPSRR